MNSQLLDNNRGGVVVAAQNDVQADVHQVRATVLRLRGSWSLPSVASTL